MLSTAGHGGKQPQWKASLRAPPRPLSALQMAAGVQAEERMRNFLREQLAATRVDRELMSQVQEVLEDRGSRVRPHVTGPAPDGDRVLFESQAWLSDQSLWAKYVGAFQEDLDVMKRNFAASEDAASSQEPEMDSEAERSLAIDYFYLHARLKDLRRGVARARDYLFEVAAAKGLHAEVLSDVGKIDAVLPMSPTELYGGPISPAVLMHEELSRMETRREGPTVENLLETSREVRLKVDEEFPAELESFDWKFRHRFGRSFSEVLDSTKDGESRGDGSLSAKIRQIEEKQCLDGRGEVENNERETDDNSEDAERDTVDVEVTMPPGDSKEALNTPYSLSRARHQQVITFASSRLRGLRDGAAVEDVLADDGGQPAAVGPAFRVVQTLKKSMVRKRSGGVKGVPGELQELFFVANDGSWDQVDRYLREHPKLLTSRYHKGRLLLHIAAQQGQAELLSKLLDLGASCYARSSWLDYVGKTPMQYASNVDCIRVLQGFKSRLSEGVLNPRRKRSRAAKSVRLPCSIGVEVNTVALGLDCNQEWVSGQGEEVDLVNKTLAVRTAGGVGANDVMLVPLSRETLKVRDSNDPVSILVEEELGITLHRKLARAFVTSMFEPGLDPDNESVDELAETVFQQRVSKAKMLRELVKENLGMSRLRTYKDRMRRSKDQERTGGDTATERVTAERVATAAIAAAMEHLKAALVGFGTKCLVETVATEVIATAVECLSTRSLAQKRIAAMEQSSKDINHS